MALPLTIDEALFEWCTPRQREVLEAVNLHGSAKAASIALGINQGAASDAYIRSQKERRLVQDMLPLMTSLGQCPKAM
jgi:molybdenum-dependent DNA-binding transcriptional regulator ModE